MKIVLFKMLMEFKLDLKKKKNRLKLLIIFLVVGCKIFFDVKVVIDFSICDYIVMQIYRFFKNYENFGK